MSSGVKLTDNFFTLFGLPVSFDVERAHLNERFRKLQGELHPDRFASASQYEQRLAIQYSARVNEAYETLRRPLDRALYLLELEGFSQEDISRQQVDGGFLIMQMELREKLESLGQLVDPEEVVEHLMAEITADVDAQRASFRGAYEQKDFDGAARACVKMQYLTKLLEEAEQVEASLSG